MGRPGLSRRDLLILASALLSKIRSFSGFSQETDLYPFPPSAALPVDVPQFLNLTKSSLEAFKLGARNEFLIGSAIALSFTPATKLSSEQYQLPKEVKNQNKANMPH